MSRKGDHLVIFHYGEVASADFILNQPSGWFFVPSTCGICHLARRSRDFGPSLPARDAVTGGLFLLFSDKPLDLGRSSRVLLDFCRNNLLFWYSWKSGLHRLCAFPSFSVKGNPAFIAVRFPVVFFYTGIRLNKLCAYPYLTLIFEILPSEVFFDFFRWASALF